MERKCDSDDIYESEFSRQAVKKAAERFEKVASEESSSSPRMPPPSLSSLGARGRSKSIGHSLAQKLQEADEEVAKPVLPWAVSTDDQVSILQLNFGSKYFFIIICDFKLCIFTAYVKIIIMLQNQRKLTKRTVIAMCSLIV